MTRDISQGLLNYLKETYKRGTRVQLEMMDDPQAPPKGTKGTVIFVDDIGTIHVRWDNGSSLGVVYGHDSCSIIQEVVTRCFGDEVEWASRDDAIEYFLEASLDCDGPERRNYENVYLKLKKGSGYATDE